MMNEGARMKAMATAKKRPTVKMMRAYERKFDAVGLSNPPFLYRVRLSGNNFVVLTYSTT